MDNLVKRIDGFKYKQLLTTLIASVKFQTKNKSRKLTRIMGEA